MSNITTGMVSVTFRNLGVEQVVEAVKRARLDGIEWGGDIHVPSGDFERAAYVRKLCDNAGIKILSYGSYYRAGQGQHFTPVVETAKALGAPNVRVWAGIYGSETTPDNRMAVTADLKRICGKAAKRGISVSVEYHGGTLTDEPASAVLLAQEVDEPNFSLYWQPNQHRDVEENIAALKAVLPYLSNVHVFAWEGQNKYLLANHAAQWKEYINIIRADGKPHGLFLEFSWDGSEQAFLDDAEYLKEVIEVQS